MKPTPFLSLPDHYLARARERIIASTLATSDGCWVWQRKVDHGGYGQARFTDAGGRKRDVGAHRFSWAAFRGPIPPGLQIDHVCRNTLCVNPDHLEPVSSKENVRRGKAALGRWGRQRDSHRTTCNHGHPLNDDNVLYYARADGYVVRICKPCRARSSREWKARRRNAA